MELCIYGLVIVIDKISTFIATKFPFWERWHQSINLLMNYINVFNFVLMLGFILRLLLFYRINFIWIYIFNLCMFILIFLLYYFGYYFKRFIILHNVIEFLIASYQINHYHYYNDYDHSLFLLQLLNFYLLFFSGTIIILIFCLQLRDYRLGELNFVPNNRAFIIKQISYQRLSFLDKPLNNNKCPICFGSYQKNPIYYLMECGHSAHANCLDKWWSNSKRKICFYHCRD